MKFYYIFFLFLWFYPSLNLYACGQEGCIHGSIEAPAPFFDLFPPQRHMMGQGHMMGKRRGRHRRMEMKPRLKSELQIRAQLEERYLMSEKDIEEVLKARREILKIMEKYRSQAGETVPLF